MGRIFKTTIQVVFLIAVTAAFGFAGQAARPGRTASGAQIKASSGKAPMAVFPQLKYNFDPVFEGTEIKYAFAVENKGDAPLIIRNIRPD